MREEAAQQPNYGLIFGKTGKGHDYRRYGGGELR